MTERQNRFILPSRRRRRQRKRRRVGPALRCRRWRTASWPPWLRACRRRGSGRSCSRRAAAACALRSWRRPWCTRGSAAPWRRPPRACRPWSGTGSWTTGPTRPPSASSGRTAFRSVTFRHRSARPGRFDNVCTGYPPTPPALGDWPSWTRKRNRNPSEPWFEFKSNFNLAFKFYLTYPLKNHLVSFNNYSSEKLFWLDCNYIIERRFEPKSTTPSNIAKEFSNIFREESQILGNLKPKCLSSLNFGHLLMLFQHTFKNNTL